MSERLSVDICVIGAGSGGLSVAAGASQMGASVVLVEKGKMGGDCLNYGCVPSKALLAAAKAAATVRGAVAFGVNGHEPAIDFARVHQHVRSAIAAIAPMDSVERFTGLGVRVIQAPARFLGAQEVEAGEVRISARRIVVATGSRPAAPPIPGLDNVPYLTNETIFEMPSRPEHLIVIGGGPIGVEMAQAHRRLGSRVSLIESMELLGKDDPELVAVVRRRLQAEGVEIREQSSVLRVDRAGNGVAVQLKCETGEDRIEGSDLLVAAGRRPCLDGLDLERADIAYTEKGITVDSRLRTTNKRIFAVGDVAGGYQFTHAANYHAGIVIRNALFRLPARVDYRALPWVTYTDPELAQVGMTEAAARKQLAKIRLLRWPFHDNDRAHTERTLEGMAKVVTTSRGRILGAGIVGAHAGELILPWALAISQGMGIGKMASLIAPYPSLSEVSKRAAASFFTPSLFGERTRRVVRFLARFG
ncbi:MAG: FAD-dependent oxidoreductase [Proteobacteria bacterium]|nr:FAD-dependent oxidoreductase [Pseudomonadota bacterium]MBI3499342.1 FAD-dependent oxidoreductase [Pseudomonadota bacterium]